MWGIYTNSSADLSFYRRSTAVSGDKVCSGTVASGKVTLAQANSSGISGTADVDNGTPGTNPAANATLDVVVSYADENDLLQALPQAANFLASGLYPGSTASETRFERLLKAAKRQLDDWLLAKFQERMRFDTWGRPLLAHVERVGTLARAHALLCLHQAYLNRAGASPENAGGLAEFYYEFADREFTRLYVGLDYERDLEPNASAFLRQVRVERA